MTCEYIPRCAIGYQGPRRVLSPLEELRQYSKRFSDGSHAAAKFTATGEPSSQDSPALTKRDGPLNIAPQRNRPLVVSGNVEICSGMTGRTVLRTTQVALCRCGHSQSKPLCDASHNRVGFQARHPSPQPSPTRGEGAD